MFYQMKQGVGPAFEEWGAKFAPVFFLMLGGALLVATLIGLLLRIAFERFRARHAQSTGEVM